MQTELQAFEGLTHTQIRKMGTVIIHYFNLTFVNVKVQKTISSNFR